MLESSHVKQSFELVFIFLKNNEADFDAYLVHVIFAPAQLQFLIP